MMVSVSEERLIPVLLAGAAATVVALALFSKKSTRKRRRLSFTSVGLGVGTFPPAAQVKEPIINAVLYFDDCPSAEDVAETIVRPLLSYERMSHVPDLSNRSLRESSHGNNIKPMDLVRTIHIDGDEKTTHKTVVEHCQDALGHDRDDLPWWEILIVRNNGSGSSCAVIRIHHVIGDGLSLVAAFDKILSNEDGSPIQSPLSSTTGERKKLKKKKSGLEMIWSLICATVHVLTLGATKYDDDTIFSRMNNSYLKHSGRREAVLFPTIPLDFVKKLKAAADVTVNDLLMAAVSQAIHDYCKAQNDPVLESKKGSDLQCRALLPVGFPRSQESLNDPTEAMKNLWCMVSCDMGVGFIDVMERLRYINIKTKEMKDKPRAYMQLKVQNNLGPYIPNSMGQQTVFDTFSRHSLVLTNVPGPSKRVLFAGKLVKSTQLFFDNLLTQVDIISYGGQVYGNIVFDADQLPNSESLGPLYASALVNMAGRLDIDVPPEVKKAAALA